LTEKKECPHLNLFITMYASSFRPLPPPTANQQRGGIVDSQSKEGRNHRQPINRGEESSTANQRRGGIVQHHVYQTQPQTQSLYHQSDYYITSQIVLSPVRSSTAVRAGTLVLNC
jgi:hypothetical protein